MWCLNNVSACSSGFLFIHILCAYFYKYVLILYASGHQPGGQDPLVGHVMKLFSPLKYWSVITVPATKILQMQVT